MLYPRRPLVDNDPLLAEFVSSNSSIPLFFHTRTTQVNKMTVMRSIVRGRFWGRRDSTTASAGGDMFGLVYSADEEVPRTSFYNQLRRYRDWVRGSTVVGG